MSSDVRSPAVVAGPRPGQALGRRIPPADGGARGSPTRMARRTRTRWSAPTRVALAAASRTARGVAANATFLSASGGDATGSSGCPLAARTTVSPFDRSSLRSPSRRSSVPEIGPDVGPTCRPNDRGGAAPANDATRVHSATASGSVAVDHGCRLRRSRGSVPAAGSSLSHCEVIEENHSTVAGRVCRDSRAWIDGEVGNHICKGTA